MVDCNLTSRVKALLLFNGLPGSGKSYTANELVKNARNYKFMSVHFDKNIMFGDNNDYDVSFCTTNYLTVEKWKVKTILIY